MPEPTTVLAATIATAISSVTLALFGVDYYSLLYGLVGAMFALSFAGAMGRGRAVLYVMLSTLVGAVIGNLVTSHFKLEGRTMLIALCFVGGLTAQALALAIFKAAPGLTELAVRGIEKFLGVWAGGSKP